MRNRTHQPPAEDDYGWFGKAIIVLIVAISLLLAVYGLAVGIMVPVA